MATKTTIEVSCDVCKNPIPNPDPKWNRDYQVIMTTEQTEGRCCKPYLQIHKLDLCQACRGEVHDGRAIYGQGAMGYCTYHFAKACTCR